MGHNSDFPTVSTPALKGSQIHEFPNFLPTLPITLGSAKFEW